MTLPAVNPDRVIATFLQLVQIDSPTYEEQAINAALERRLTDLGFAVRNDGTGPNGVGNVIGHSPARPDAARSAIALVAHTDTVQPGRGIRPIVDAGVIRASGSTILGADNKQAVAAVLEAVETVLASGLPYRPFDVVFTWGEEKGHQGAHHLDLSGLRARSAFIFDAGDDIGVVINETPTAAGVQASFRGRAAHAGIEPERGINAIQAAAIAISRMRLGRLDADTTANVGLIEGGTVRNAVPERAVVHGETRSMNPAALDAQLQAMRAACDYGAAAVGASVEVEVTISYRGFRLAADSPVVVEASDALARAGFTPRLGRTGGGSDANTLNERGLPAVNLGTAMRDLHSTREHVAVQDLVDLAKVIVALLVY